MELRDRLSSALQGRYTIGREIGRGGMAVVYLARDLRHERNVALKVLRPELAATLGVDRFLQEIHLAAGLAHPHILPLHDSGEADGCLFFVMPFVAGESLRDRLEREKQLPLVEALGIAREIADALDYAHREGVVHRDIKPENILLEAGHAVVSDFGIARAISAAGSRRVTAVGTTVGTPDYMSPEQAAAVGPIDGRSDVYSLGCVLFEMLAGEPPNSLTPPEGPAAGPLRSRDRLAELVALRPTIPPAVAAIVVRMLEPKPGDRFATGGEAAEALAAPSDVWTPRSVLATRRRRWGVGLLAGSAIVTAAIIVLPKVTGAAIDRTRYVVIPSIGTDTQSTKLNGNDVERLLDDAFERWTDLRLVSELELHGLMQRRGDLRPSLDRALAYARELGAGHLVWIEVASLVDSTEIVAGVYDVVSGRSELRSRVRVGRDGADLGKKLDQLASALLLGTAPSAAFSGAMGTRLLGALRAYTDGHTALKIWDLEIAIKAFREALARDPEFPQAHLWLAQVMEWSGKDSTLWRRSAERAAAARDTLSVYERTLATGLVALETGQYPEACARYREIIKRDQNDFAGWFGLGECQAKDDGVVHDEASPSGWRFRSSYHGAIQAYSRALKLVPSAFKAFTPDRLSSVFRFTEMNQFRRGFALVPDTQWYAAFPSLEHDTLAFIPYLQAEVLLATRPEVTPNSQASAIAHNRDVILDVATAWARALTESPDAAEVLASVLESRGDLPETRPEERSALAMIRRARRFARDSLQGLRLAVAEVRVLTKLEELEKVRHLADSLLGAWRDPDPATSARLVGLAALTGRAHRAAQLLAQAADDLTVQSGDRQVPVRPIPLARAAFALRGYAALGAPAESVTALYRRVDRLVDASIEPERRETVRDDLLRLARDWSYPLLGANPPRLGSRGLFIPRMLWALEQHDTGTIRAIFDTMRAQGTNIRPGDVDISATYTKARVLLAIGDTAAATELIGGSLDALTTLGTGLLNREEQAAALVRAMALRADLAQRAGDSTTARHWAAAVVALWSDADADELLGIAERMRQLTRGRER